MSDTCFSDTQKVGSEFADFFSVIRTGNVNFQQEALLFWYMFNVGNILRKAVTTDE